MAEQYSSAVLGLGIDVKQFNKELASTSLRTQGALEKMKMSADAFGEKWENLTAGIKDTKRIISGILISQGFYALSNVMIEGAGAALTFAKNMETAAISMEYFVEGADKANKAAAFLREMNEFAARTPFSTEQALSLSKYMQAVGVSMTTTKSFLQVITDTAAATGATEENLQRIVFGLGQMMTKGRIANEEIRQLANANIPIYEILQEELNLTGEQISNIGKYWIGSDKAIVAILSGLEKRYSGAADRISDTVTGMTDTIVDNMKIIAQSAGGGLYNSLSENMSVLRDALDRYRDIAVTQGSTGLFNQILIDIDSTGQLGNEILALIGNVRQLGGALKDLYIAGSPLVSLFGKAFYASISAATITLTGFARAADGLVGLLNRLGITTGTTAEVIGTLFIAYKAATWMGTLGQGAVTAAYSLYQTVASMGNILPAAVRANTGVALLTSGLAGLVTMGLAVAGIFGMINNMSAGLDVSGGGFSQDYLDAMAEYEAEMDAYNKSIAKYQESFNQPYTAIDDGSDQAVSDLEDVEKASKKAAGSVKKDWVAAFDEVYSVPDSDNGGGGSGDETTLPDLGALLKLPRFIFPELKVEQLKMPEFKWGDLYDGSPFGDLPDKDWLATLLPGILTGAAIAAGQILAKKRQTDIAAKEAEGKAVKDATAKPSITEDPKVLTKQLIKQGAANEALLSKISKSTDELLSAIQRERLYGTAGPEASKITGLSEQLKAGLKELEKITSGINDTRAALGHAPIEYAQRTAALEAIRQGEVISIKKQLAAIDNQLKAVGLTAAELTSIESTQEALLSDIKRLGGVTPNSLIDVGALDYRGLAELLDDLAGDVAESFNDVFSGALPKIAGVGRHYDIALLKEANKAWQDFIYVADRMKLFAESADPASNIGNTTMTTLQGFRRDIDLAFKNLLAQGSGSAERLEQVARGLARRDNVQLPEAAKEAYNKMLSKVDEQADFLRSMNNLLRVYSHDSLLADAEREERRKAAELAAAQQREEQIALQKKAQAAEAAERKRRIEEQTGRQVVGSNTKIDARYQDALYRINRNTETAAIRLAEISEETKTGLKGLRKELQETLNEITERVFFVESHLSNPKFVNVSQAALPKNVQDAITEIGLLKHNVASIVTELELMGKKVPKAAYDILGQQLHTNTILRTIAEDNHAAWMAFQDAIKSIVPSSKLPATAAQALDLAKIGVPQALMELSDAANITARNFMLTGTKLEIAAKGIGSFDGDIPSTVAKAFQEAGLDNFSKLIIEQADLQVRAAAALGTKLEDIVAAIAAQKMVPEFGSIEGGGFKVADGMPLLTQIDTTMKIWDDLGKSTKVIANDVKTKTGKAMQELIDGSTEYAAGIRKLPQEVLERVAPAHYAQFIAQAKAMNTNMIGMSAFNRDFDFTEIDEALVNRWKQLMKRSGLTSATGGRIFSVDALLEYGNLTGTISSGIDEAAEAYFENVITPLLTTRTGIDFSPLQHGFQQFIIEFSDDAIKSFNIGNVSKAFMQYNRLVATVADNPNIAEFLQAYVRLNTEAGEAIASLNFTPVLRSYAKMTGRANKWMQNILKIDDTFSRGAIGKPLQQAIDKLVTEYTTAVSKAANIDQAAELATKFSDQMDKLSKAAEIYGAGGELDYSFEKLFEGSKRSIDDMRLLQRTLDTLANRVDLVNRVPRLMRTLTDSTRRINTSLLRGAQINAETLMSASKTAEQLFDLLGISTTKAADMLILQLTDMQQIAARSVDRMAAFNPAVYKQLEMPFEILDITETLQYTAGKIKAGVENGLLKVSDSMAAEFNAVMSEVDTKMLANDFIGRFKASADTLFSRYIIDLETTGLPEATQLGKKLPEIVQVSMIDNETGKIYNWFVDYGSRNQEIVNRMGSILESWKDVPAKQLETGLNIRDILEDVRRIVGEQLVSGYNAVNLGQAGGAFDIRLMRAIMGDEFLKLGDDVMDMVAKTVEQYTGTQQRFKLTDIYEMITGQAAEGAHMAETDVFMTSKVMQAVQDGTLDQIVRVASESGFEGGVKQALIAAGKTVNQAGNTVVEPIVETVTDAAKETAKIVEEAAEATAGAAADAAKEATKSGKTIFDSATETAANMATKFTERVKTFWARFNDGWGGIGNAAKNIDMGIDLFDSFDDLVAAAQKFEPFQIAFNKAKAAMEAGLATPKTAWVKEAVDAYNKAHVEYAKVSKTFYKNIIDTTSESLKGFDNAGTLFKTAADLFDEGAGYMSFVIDPKTGALKLLNDTLFSAGDELQQLFLKTAAKATEGMKLSDEALQLAFGEFKLYTEGLKSADELTDAAKAIKAAFEEVSNTTVILDAAGNVRYAGAAAAKAVDDASDALSTSFKSVGKKLIAGVGGFGLLDVVGIAVAGVVQNMADTSREEALGQRLRVYDDTGVVTELDRLGLDVGKLIGDSIYNGVWQAVGQETFSAALGGLVTTAILAIPGVNIAAIIAAAIGGGVAVGTDLIMGATGGKSDTNLYLDDYLSVLAKGNVVTEESLKQIEETLGRQLTLQERKGLEEDARATLNYELMVGAKNNFWDRDEINKILFGENTTANLIDSKYRKTEAETKAELRLAEALDILKYGDESGIYKNTRMYNTGDYAETITTLSVRDEAALEYLEGILGANLKLGEAVKDGTGFNVLYEEGGSVYAPDSSNIEGLRELLNLVYKQGIGSGDMVEALNGFISNNEAINKAIVAKYGEVVTEAYANFDDMLALYNELNGTSMRREDADQIEGFSERLMEQMVQIYNAYVSTWSAQATEQARVDTSNRNIMEGDTSSIIWNGSLNGMTKEVIDELAKFGLALSEGSIQIDTELSGLVDQTYIQLSTNAEQLRDNLAGWTLDASTYTGLDFKEVVLSAEDVSVLAQAGIQINSDGTIDFMRAINEEVTGNERTMNLDASSFSQAILDALGGVNIGIDFDTSQLTFGGMAGVKDKMSGAMFALPANIKQYLSKEMTEALSGLGTVMDSGYLMITNKAVLNGTMTIQEYVNAMAGGVDTLSPKVLEALQNVDALIQQEGASVADNIIEWANGVVIPSPIKAEQLTPEIEAAFAQIGISFTEYGEEFLMVINSTGEHIKDGMTLIDAEKWNEIDADIRKALEDMGVIVTTVGNQVMVDLGNTFDNGIYDVVALFTEQPEVWNQIPDAVKQTLVDAGVVTEGELIKIKTLMDGKLTDIADGWIATWDSLAQPTKDALAKLGLNVDDGLLKIDQIVDAADIPELVDGQIAVPFEELPEEIREALGAQGLEGELKGKTVVLSNATSEAFAGMMETLRQTKSDAVTEAETMATSIANAVTNALQSMERMKNINVGKSGGGIFGIGSSKNTIGNPLTGSDGITYYPEYDNKGKLVTYHYYNDKGQAQTTTSVPGRAAGGAADGLTLVGEKGREIAIFPDGSMQFVGQNGGEVTNFPRGTHIVNNKDSEAIAKYVSNNRMKVRQLAAGSVKLDTTTGTKAKLSLGSLFDSAAKDTYAAGQASWDAARNKNALAGPKLLKDTQDGWNAFSEAVIGNIDTTFMAGYSDWNTFVATSLLRAYGLDSSSWSSLPNNVSDRVGSTGKQGVDTWAQFVQNNPLVALLLKAGTDSTGWDSLPAQTNNKVTTAGKSASATWASYVQSNPLRSLNIDASSWKMLENASIANMESLINSMQKALDNAALKATITLSGNVSIGGGAGFDDTVYDTGGGFVNTFINGQGYISSGYGMRIHPISGKPKFHHGVDIAATHGTPIKAGIAGTVQRGYDSGYGNYVDVVGANGSFTRMAHMSAFNNAFKSGSTVTAGNIVGYVGSTGNSTGPHVHVEYHPGGGGSANPRNYFLAEGGYADGLAMVAEKGRELAIMPDGSIQLLSDAALYDLPTGTHIINNGDTEKMLKYAGGISRLKEVRALEEGNTTVVTAPEEGNNAEANEDAAFRALFIAFMKTFIAAHEAEAEDSTIDMYPKDAVATDEGVRYIVENIHVAIRGALAAITEYGTTQQQTQLMRFTEYVSTITAAIGTGATDIKAAIATMSESVSSAVQRISQNTNRYEQNTQTSTSLYEQMSDIIEEAKREWNAATDDAGRTAAHDKAEAARAKLGYSGGADGSKYIPLVNIKVETDDKTSTVEANADSGTVIKASAMGSVVTDDSLVRVGEFGKNEAIVPLEQPSVMAALGAAIGPYVADDADKTAQLIAFLEDRLMFVTENMHAAVRGAVSAISEQDMTQSQNYAEHLNSTINALKIAIEDFFKTNTSSVVTALETLGNSITTAFNDMRDSISSLKEAAKDIAATTNKTGTAIGEGVQDIIAQAKKEYAEAKTDSERAAAHDKAEAARAQLGYSGGTDGSQYIPLGTTIKANAAGSVVKGDQLVRVGEFGRREAILPLEQPSVMMALGEKIGAYVTAQENNDQLIATLIERGDYLVENLHVAIRGAVGTLSEQGDRSDVTMQGRLTALSTELKTGFDEAIKVAAADIVTAVNSMGSQINSAFSNMQSAMSSLKEAANSMANNNAGSSSNSMSADQLIAAAKNEWNAATTDAGRAAAHAKAEAVRATLGYSGGEDGSKYIPIKGSARGSLVTKDALYRAGEFGLNEAIIPLERPDIMGKIGTAIAGSMPVEQSQLLSRAVGMQNAGISLPAPQPTHPTQQQVSTDAIVQSVLESVLPAMAGMGEDDQDRRPIYVGNLIADEQGLKMLERKLYTIRQAEQSRRL